MTWKAMAWKGMPGLAIVETVQTVIRRPADRNAENLCHDGHAGRLLDQEGTFRCGTWFVADTVS